MWFWSSLGTRNNLPTQQTAQRSSKSPCFTVCFLSAQWHKAHQPFWEKMPSLWNETGAVHLFYGAFPLRGTTRLGMLQNGTARFSSARFVFPLQFSTLEWAGLFMCRYSCATSTAVTPEKLFNSAPLHQALAGSAQRTSVLPQKTTVQPFFGC